MVFLSVKDVISVSLRGDEYKSRICYKNVYFLKKNENARKPSEHPSVMGTKCKNV